MNNSAPERCLKCGNGFPGCTCPSLAVSWDNTRQGLPQLEFARDEHECGVGSGIFYTSESVNALLEEIEKRMIQIEQWANNINCEKPSTEHLTWLGLIAQTAEVTKEQIQEERK